MPTWTNVNGFWVPSSAVGDAGQYMIANFTQAGNRIQALESVGVSGFSGYSGTSGVSGATGTGTSGFSGQSGASGFSGQNGTAGVSGFSGASGYSGLSGLSGYSGVGTAGASGVSGFSGASGRSGYSGAPSIVNAASPITYNPGTKTVGISTDPTFFSVTTTALNVTNIQSAGVARFYGGVDEDPQGFSRLDIGVDGAEGGSQSARIVFESAGFTPWQMDVDSDIGGFRWYTPGTVHMRLDEGGNLYNLETVSAGQMSAGYVYTSYLAVSDLGANITATGDGGILLTGTNVALTDGSTTGSLSVGSTHVYWTPSGGSPVQLDTGPGVSGYSGFSGKSGYSGATGTGVSGFSGTSGAVGTSGYSGVSGATGITTATAPITYNSGTKTVAISTTPSFSTVTATTGFTGGGATLTAANAEVLKIRSGSTSAYAYLTVGRTSDELQFGGGGRERSVL